MCLTVYTDAKTRKDAIKECKKIAKKDIIVYKTLYEHTGFKNTILRSPYMTMDYKIGYHYYQTGRKFGIKYVRNNCDLEYSYIDIDEGLHAYTTIKTALKNYIRSMYINCIVQCRIPKGSEYFIDNTDEIVTDNLILEKMYEL